VRRVFFDGDSNEPVWVSIGARTFGTRQAVVPLAGSTLGPTGLAVAVRRAAVHEGPAIDPDRELTVGDAEQVRRHYGQSDVDLSAPPPSRNELTRWEERLRVDTETVESGKARLHKSVVTEPVETSVTLRHERARVERRPARESDAHGHQFAEEDVELTLHADRPTVSKTAVPVESVRLQLETTTEEHPVHEELRKERIEVEDQSDL
jgi:uncharacterized protein (TIGR02271 family)